MNWKNNDRACNCFLNDNDIQEKLIYIRLSV